MSVDQQPRHVDEHLEFQKRSIVLSLILKIVALGIVIAFPIALTPALVGGRQWIFLAIVYVIAALIVGVYATRKLIPAKYLLPGTLLLALFVVVPILITAQTSFSNYGDGTRGTKDETIARIIGGSVVQTPNAPRYNLSIATTGSPTTGPFHFFLVSQDDGSLYRGDAEGLEELSEGDVTVEGEAPANFIREADGYTFLTPVEVNDAGDVLLNEFSVPTEEGAIRALGINQAFEGSTNLEYDEASDTFTDTTTGTTYTVQQDGDREYYMDEAGNRISDQSWRANVGFLNYQKIFTDSRIRADFIRIFIWTIAFAVLSVAGTFLLGLLLAVTLNDDRVKGQRAYRMMLIMPYAIPGFISLLLWASFYNRDFGLINDVTGLNVNWLGNPWAAKLAVILTNLWMGFPYMFLVCTGALQSISGELKEAARIDGASGWAGFTRITFPLLLVSVAPLLVATFAFNFNNFNAIQLLTEGGPFTPDNPTAGGTDILISYTIRLAFGGGGAQIGFASAISVLLFVITGVLAAIQFRATRSLEDVN